MTRDLTQDAVALATGTPASGQPPNPGPLPRATDTERTPVRWGFSQAYNATQTPGRGKLAAFAILRQLADVSDITRICIEARKDQITGLEWEIVSRDKKAKADRATLAKVEGAKAFFRRPDKRRDFKTWLRMICEEIFVIDALSVYRRRTRGGDLYALEVKDGSTIIPLLDQTGDTPMAPNVAYRQIISGRPVEGGDCTVDQLYYRPRTARVHTPYGMSPTEAVLLTVNAALQRASFNLAYYSEGNIPRGLMSAPEGWTPDQIEKFQTMWDELLTGNLVGKSRMRIVGNGMAESFKQYVDPDFSTAFDEFLLKVNCAAFGVTPSELGFTSDVNKSTSQGQENITYRRGVRPLVLFLQDFFDEILANDLLMPDLQFKFIGGEPEDRKLQAEIDKLYWSIGKVSTDDLRQRDGQDPIGLGPMIETPMGPMPVEDLLNAGVDKDPDTSEVDAPSGATDPAELEAAAQKDLRAWKAVALKDLKRGGTVREFTSDVLPADVKLTVRLGLLKAKSPRDVVAVFEALAGGPVWAAEAVEKDIQKASEYRTFVGAPRVAMARYRRHFAKVFKAQGEALATHLRAAVGEDE